MSQHALPVLFINMGGEMLYILDQRLHAQKIDNEKARKVLNDIVGTMFNKRFMEELFRPQELFTRNSLRVLFDRLAHASIMRLNSASMDKLYDLMTMAVKFQVYMAERPRDLLMVCLNHLDWVAKQLQGEDSPAKQALFCTYKLLALLDKQLGYGDWQAMRHCLMNFFQDTHTRVSIFLKEGTQDNSGRFRLPFGGPLPAGFAKLGNVQLYTNRGKPLQPASFSVKQFNGQSREGSADMRGDRGTSLGCNMYAGGQVDTSAPPTQQPTGSESRQQQKQQQRSKGAPTPQLVAAPSDLDSYQTDPNAAAQLDLLAQLIGSGPRRSGASGFRLNLFRNDAEEEEAESVVAASAGPTPGARDHRVLNFDAREAGKGGRDRLSHVMRDLRLDDDDANDDGGDYSRNRRGGQGRTRSGGGGQRNLLDLMDEEND
ncbi:hypothetical protein BOX15_Mlig002990g1 [Macrostomum lignano]|uniref:Protein OSCP1 n=1 Tax=Macrostomum lignano TaxID=282301 RepID=A0A267E3D0_9PLAT|nr:hypothetical protein BOX15_Mlig002990g1 [Macrostomum lignano]